MCALPATTASGRTSARATTPSPKGIVEALVGYAKSDLVVPEGLAGADLARANEAAGAWCDEVNGRRHSETCAVPAERAGGRAAAPAARCPSLRPSFGQGSSRKVDRLSCVRFGSARYSVPTKLIGRSRRGPGRWGPRSASLHFGEVVATHDLVAPGEASVKDEHYGGPAPPAAAPAPPAHGGRKSHLRPGRSGRSLHQGGGRRRGDQARQPSWRSWPAWRPPTAREALVAALARAVEFSRYKAADVRSILAAGTGLPRPAGTR